jgi:hypothetical protein
MVLGPTGNHRFLGSPAAPAAGKTIPEPHHLEGFSRLPGVAHTQKFDDSRSAQI